MNLHPPPSQDFAALWPMISEDIARCRDALPPAEVCHAVASGNPPPPREPFQRFPAKQEKNLTVAEKLAALAVGEHRIVYCTARPDRYIAGAKRCVDGEWRPEKTAPNTWRVERTA